MAIANEVAIATWRAMMASLLPNGPMRDNRARMVMLTMPTGTACGTATSGSNSALPLGHRSEGFRNGNFGVDQLTAERPEWRANRPSIPDAFHL